MRPVRSSSSVALATFLWILGVACSSSSGDAATQGGTNPGGSSSGAALSCANPSAANSGCVACVNAACTEDLAILGMLCPTYVGCVASCDCDDAECVNHCALPTASCPSPLAPVCTECSTVCATSPFAQEPVQTGGGGTGTLPHDAGASDDDDSGGEPEGSGHPPDDDAGSEGSSDVASCLKGAAQYYGGGGEGACTSCTQEHCASEVAAACGADWQSECNGGSDGAYWECICECTAAGGTLASCAPNCSQPPDGPGNAAEQCLQAHCQSSC